MEIDTQIGRLRQEIARQLGHDTMLWITSDNGPEGVNAPSLGSDSSPGSAAGLRGRKRDVRITPLKNGGDHSCCGRFGPLRNRPRVFWRRFLDS